MNNGRDMAKIKECNLTQLGELQTGLWMQTGARDGGDRQLNLRLQFRISFLLQLDRQWTRCAIYDRSCPLAMAELYPSLAQCAIATAAFKTLLFPA